jgi:putative addiction module killer protein
MKLTEYETLNGHRPFEKWFDKLNASVAAKITIALSRLERGHTGNIKGVGEGVQEYKINLGPGYRIYFANDGQRLIILLCGGTKKRQQKDIETAKEYWQDYKKRKKEGA